MEWLILSKEDDGRWFGEIPSLPGVMAYGRTEKQARDSTIALARRVIADRIKHGELIPEFLKELFPEQASSRRARAG